eukprot:11164187-Lingulodinium_polyedra.AAC.1
MPGCVQCVGGDMPLASIFAAGVDTATSLTSIVAARDHMSAGKRQRKHSSRPGHVKRMLVQELGEDRQGHVE